MGILNFLKTIRKIYPNCINDKFLDSYDNLYIDLNHALYHVVVNSTTKKEVITNLKSYLFNIVDRAKPKKKIYICSDGVAPLAKMIEQRKRRIDRNKMDLSMNFTAGTKFMLELESRLNDFKMFLEKMLYVDVIIDIINDGEGEIKIKKYLVHNLDDTSLIFSGDSDMVLILLLTDKINNLYQLVNKDEIISIERMYQDHINKYVIKECKNSRQDMVFIFLLSGNDYLPKVKNFNLENYLKSYKKIVNKLDPEESGLTKFNDSKLEVNYINLFILDNHSTKLNKKNYKYNFDQSDNVYEKYFYGLTWCMDMYKTGICKDYQFIYDCEEPYSILMSIYLKRKNTFEIVKNSSIDFKLYGILLIPKYANELIDDDQKVMSEKIDSKFNIYEEETCEKCKEIKIKIDEVKTKYNSCSKITSDTFDIMKDELKESNIYDKNNNDMINVLESYKNEYWIKLKKLKSDLTKQKNKYKTLDSKKLKKIQKFFDKIK